MAGTRKKNTKKTVKPGKELLESNIEDFKGKLSKALDQGISELSIDMKGVKNIDASGLGILIAANNSLDQTGGQLNLTNVPENIENIMQLLGLDKYLNVSAA